MIQIEGTQIYLVHISVLQIRALQFQNMLVKYVFIIIFGLAITEYRQAESETSHPWKQLLSGLMKFGISCYILTI